MMEAEGFEPCPMVLRTPRLEWWTARDLRSLLADRVRSCPSRTSGSWCRADPARTSILTEWQAADQKSPPRNLGTRDTACPDSPAQAPAMQAQLAANPVEPVAEAGHGLLPRGGAILSPTIRLLRGAVTRTTTQTGAKRSKPPPRRRGGSR